MYSWFVLLQARAAMAYSPKAVANFILTQAFGENMPISPMKLQKLLYYMQGWHLAFCDEPIFNEQIECWPYGPVVSSIFHHFKRFGKDPINEKATDVRLRKKDGKRVLRMGAPVLPSSLPSESREVLDAVWNSYKGLSAIKLSNMTHSPDGPWRKVYDEHNGAPPTGTDIPMDLIRQHFKAQLEEDI
jgi:uncharacterized phage-associated protein